VKKLLLLFLVLASLDVTAQRSPDWDATFRAIPEARNIGESVRTLSARPHHLGSPYGKQNAEWMLAKFKEWGWDARIENYDVLFPAPKERLVEMVAPTRARLALEEPAVSVDPTSSQKAEQLPSFNA
jgi:N-acetylated-alpha-linked acidic dipeptidase